MPECDYCGASFDSEAAELNHLKSEHRDELGPIDRRRVGDVDEDDEGMPAGPIALGIVLLASAGIVAYVVFIAGGTDGNAGQPTHIHGTMNATIDGQQLDLMSPEYTRQDQRFHFHGVERTKYGANVWHVHVSGVTLKYALGTLGIEVNDDGTRLTFNGTTYDDSEAGTEVRILVEGEPVEPGNYELSGVKSEPAAGEGEGDDIEIIVETE